MFKPFTITICILNIILIEANECDLEAYCKVRSHEGCKIASSGSAEIVPYDHQLLLQNLNKFRNDTAFGLRNKITNKEVANMNILKWNKKLELLSPNENLKFNYTKIQNLCYATSLKANFEYQHDIIKDPAEFSRWLTMSLIEKNETNSVLCNPSSHDIGCALTKTVTSSYVIECIVYGNQDNNNFIYGEPCTQCESYEYGCDFVYKGLCTYEIYDVMALAYTNDDVHIIAMYILLGSIPVLVLLMIILIKCLRKYYKHISL